MRQLTSWVSTAGQPANRGRIGVNSPEHFQVLGGAAAGLLGLVLVAHVLDTVQAGAGAGPTSRIAETGLLLVTGRCIEWHVADNIRRVTVSDVHRERVRRGELASRWLFAADQPSDASRNATTKEKEGITYLILGEMLKEGKRIWGKKGEFIL